MYCVPSSFYVLSFLSYPICSPSPHKFVSDCVEECAVFPLHFMLSFVPTQFVVSLYLCLSVPIYMDTYVCIYVCMYGMYAICLNHFLVCLCNHVISLVIALFFKIWCMSQSSHKQVLVKLYRMDPIIS